MLVFRSERPTSCPSFSYSDSFGHSLILIGKQEGYVMLFSFELITKDLKKNSLIKVKDGNRSICFLARAGQDRHVFANIPVSGTPSVSADIDSSINVLSMGESSYMTPEQVELNRSIVSYKNTNYTLTSKGTPVRAVVTFAHYKGFGGWVNPYTMLNGVTLGLKDTLYISFQDPYLTSGSYFLVDNFGEDPIPAAAEIISELLKLHNIPEERTTFLGSSKGANIAAMVSRMFDKNQLILCAYSMDLEYRIRSTPYVHLASALDYFAVGFPDAKHIFEEEINKKETHWFYSRGDNLANRGCESIEGSFLTTYATNSGHSDVVGDHWSDIGNLITNRHS